MLSPPAGPSQVAVKASIVDMGLKLLVGLHHQALLQSVYQLLGMNVLCVYVSAAESHYWHEAYRH